MRASFWKNLNNICKLQPQEILGNTKGFLNAISLYIMVSSEQHFFLFEFIPFENLVQYKARFFLIKNEHMVLVFQKKMLSASTFGLGYFNIHILPLFPYVNFKIIKAIVAYWNIKKIHVHKCQEQCCFAPVRLL